jgi:tetratricopeptide (TPR) repeat protein
MAKPKHIDLTEDGVITQQALLAYAEGRLNDAERTEMDRLLRDDAFAQEALDGLRSSSIPGQIPGAIISINTKLYERTGMRERRKKGIEIHWANYAYAAVVLGVLIGVGFVMIHIFSNRQEQVAINNPPPQAQESLLVIEEKKKEIPAPDTIAVARNKDSSLSEPLVEAPPLASNLSAHTPDKESKTTVTNADKLSIQTPAPSPMGGEVAAQLGVARTFFEAGNYTDAEKKYNEILASQPENTDALYFGGISSYLSGSKGFGEANFNKLIKLGQYPEGTKWYKANILLKKGKKDDAKQLLRDLVNSNSIFKERSIKLYEELYNTNK